MTDNHGYVLAPLPVAPVNETDMVLLPKQPFPLMTGETSATRATDGSVSVSTIHLPSFGRDLLDAPW